MNNKKKNTIDRLRKILIPYYPNVYDQVRIILMIICYKHMDNNLKSISYSDLIRFDNDRLLKEFNSDVLFIKNNHKIDKKTKDLFDADCFNNNTKIIKEFFNVVNDYEFEHSEDIGDAFEYFLSLTNSQNAAGQFRTPKHIIDFMIDIVLDKSQQSVLDPSCGTSGFLIESYKKNNNLNKINGYDISKDMINLSNLSGFINKIDKLEVFEYDTLVNNDKWNDKFDLILSNPPFVSSSVKFEQHNKFRIKTRKSEVLFLDFILQHLTDNGRAAVIVPEGVLFNLNKSSKFIRKELLNNNLVAVISLPDGAFNPYSSVKTNILIIDKKISKNKDDILFINIKDHNNDLHEALHIIKKYYNGDGVKNLPNVKLISKHKINNHPNYELNVGIYYDFVKDNTKFPVMKIGDVCEFLNHKAKGIRKQDRKEGVYPYHGASQIIDYIDKYNFDEKLVLVSSIGTQWGPYKRTSSIAKGKYWANEHVHVIRPDRTKILDEFLSFILNKMDLNPLTKGTAMKALNKKDFANLSISVPPIDIQISMMTQIKECLDSLDKLKKNYELEKQNKENQIKFIMSGQGIKVK